MALRDGLLLWLPLSFLVRRQLLTPSLMRLRGRVILTLPPEEVPTTEREFILTCYLRGESCAGLYLSANSFSFLRAILHGEVEEILRQDDHELLEESPALDLALRHGGPKVQAAVLSKIRSWDEIAVSDLETVRWTPGLKNLLRQIPGPRNHNYLDGFLQEEISNCRGEVRLSGYMRQLHDPFALQPTVQAHLQHLYRNSRENLDIAGAKLGYFGGLDHRMPDPALILVALPRGYPELLRRQLEFLSEPLDIAPFQINLWEFGLQTRKRYQEVLALLRPQSLLRLTNESYWQLLLVCGEKVEASSEQLAAPREGEVEGTVRDSLAFLVVAVCHPQVELLVGSDQTFLRESWICPGEGLYDVVAHFRQRPPGNFDLSDLLSQLVVRNQLWEVRDCPALKTWLGTLTYGVEHRKYQEILALLQ